jgi:filamentous hemagglutinin family protein
MRFAQYYFIHLLGGLSAIGCLAAEARAQSVIVPDATLGTEGSIVESRPTFDAIKGGATRGTGLFHSFSEFGVGDRAAVNFLVTPQIQNIFARVTGTGISDIQGSIGTRIDNATLSPSTASLFLLNPNGIIFGPNATLDLAGSFLATTASGVKFGGSQEFSAVNPQAAPLLTVSVPVGLRFGEKVGAIEVNNATLATSITQSLGLIGGDIKLSDAKLTTISGQIDVGAVGADATVGLVPLPVGWKADYTGVEGFRDIQIDRGQITAGTDQVGDLAVFPVDLQLQGRNIAFNESVVAYYYAQANQSNLKTGAIKLDASQAFLLNSSRILAGTDGSIDRPDIILNANQIEMKGTKEKKASLFTTTLADGSSSGGDIKITASSLTLNGAAISTGLAGLGKAGDIEINVSGQVSILGFVVYPTSISSGIIDDVSQGRTGDIKIRAENLVISDGGYISLLAAARSRTGLIDIQVDDKIIIAETVPEAFRGAGIPSYISNSQDSNLILVDRANLEPSLGIKIQANSLLLQDGGQIRTSLVSESDAKGIQIDVRDSVRIQGISRNAFIQRNGTPAFQNSEISSSKLQGAGNSGDIKIRTRSLDLLEGGQIKSGISDGLGPGLDNTNTRAKAPFQGKAGNIIIEASDSILISGTSTRQSQSVNNSYTRSGISSDVLGSNAQGGSVLIKTKELQIYDGGFISTDMFLGRGEAGQIEIEAQGNVTIAGSSDKTGVGSTISSFSSTPNLGNSGSIRIRSESLNLLKGGGLSVVSAGAGNAGSVFVDTQGDINMSGITDQGIRSGIFGGSVQLSEEAQKSFIEFNFPLLLEPLGEGGSIFLTGDALRVTDDALISARSDGQGPAGSININLRDRLIANNGNIITVSKKTTGGSINIAARAIVLRNNANIKTNVASGSGQGGNIKLTADGIVLLDDSDLLAFARDGQGGNISLFTQALLTRTYKPSDPASNLETLDTNGFVDINATGRTSGIITLPELNPLQNSRPEIAPTLIDTDQVLSRSCLTRNPKTGKFVITGAGGIPSNPADPPLSTYSTLPVGSETAIAEADNLYTLANGQVVVGKACQTMGEKS